MQLNHKLSSNSYFIIGLLTIVLLSASVCHVEKKAIPSTKIETIEKKIEVLSASGSAIPSIAVNKDDILGVWHPKDENFNIEIFKAADEYHGKIVWLKDPKGEDGGAKLDKLNPQKNLREKPVLGLVAVKGFEFNDIDKIWEDGYIYNPMTGQSLKGAFSMVDNNTLELTGFLGFSLSEVKIIWKRM